MHFRCDGAKFPKMAEVYSTTTTTNIILEDINFSTLADKEEWEQEVSRSVKRAQPSKTFLSTTTENYAGQEQSQSKGITQSTSGAAK